MRHLVLVFACSLAAPWAVPAAQGVAPATLRGAIADESGAAIAGATVVLSDEETGAGGARRTDSTAGGAFAFHTLPPGRYLIQIERAGFRTFGDRVTLRPADHVVFDAVLERGEPAEPMARPRRSVARRLGPAMTDTLDGGLLEFVPVESRRASDVLTLAAGVHARTHSAYGAAGRSANRYTLDGLWLGDPHGEGVWADGSYRWLDSAEVLSHGAPAPHGGYSGVLLAAVLPSGGEHLTGLVEGLFTNDALTASNVSAERLEQNPGLAEPMRDALLDVSAHVGGALAPTRAWFFAGGQFSREAVTADGFPPEIEGYERGSGPSSPVATAVRGLFKPTFALGHSQHARAAVLVERLHDNALFAGRRVASAATLEATTTTVLLSLGYARVLSAAATLDARYSGLFGRAEQRPHNGEVPGVYDVVQDVYAVNAVDFYDARRRRHEIAATYSRLLGSHLLEAGVGFELSNARTETGFNGGRTIDAVFGVPTYAYTWEGDRRDASTRQFTAFVHDAWRLGTRVVVTAGARLDRTTGSLARLDGTVFETTTVAPRVGLAWAPGARATTLRATYGWYAEAAKTSYFDLLDPDVTPVLGVFVDPTLRPLATPAIVSPGTRHDIDRDIRHPRMQEAAASIERAVAGTIVVRAAGAFRRGDRFIDDVLQFAGTEFAVRTIEDVGPDGFPGTGDETGTAVRGYHQLTDPFGSRLLVTNPDGAFQEYRAFELSATRRMSESWGLHVAWVFSRTTGNYDNLHALGNTGEYDTPNVDPRYHPLREGRLTNGPTHLIQALGTYAGPWQLTAGVAFSYASGQAFTRTMRVRFAQGREEIFVEPRGSRRLAAGNQLDLRLERPFEIGPGHLSVVVEGFNLMNRATVTALTTASGGDFLTPTEVVAPRRFRVGAVYRF